MLALNCDIALWFVRGVTNMHYGKYRLFAEVEFLGRSPYNGDAYAFLSQNRQTLRIIRFKNHKRYLYDIIYEKGYKFMQTVREGAGVVYEPDFRYLVILLKCMVTKTISPLILIN